jgi:hypothetical protein
MLNFFKKLFEKKKDELSLTVTINGQSITTDNKEEIAELLKQFSECLKKDN